MAGSSDASSGGAGGAAGVGFQNLVFAWAASCVIAEVPLLRPLAAGVAVNVGAQTGSEVDDVEVLTDPGNSVCIQAKIKLQLSAASDSPAGEGLAASRVPVLVRHRSRAEWSTPVRRIGTQLSSALTPMRPQPFGPPSQKQYVSSHPNQKDHHSTAS